MPRRPPGRRPPLPRLGFTAVARTTQFSRFDSDMRQVAPRPTRPLAFDKTVTPNHARAQGGVRLRHRNGLVVINPVLVPPW